VVYVQEVLGNMKICVVIPTLNEAKTIGAIVKQIRLQGLEAFVIDDGSCDNTSQAAKTNGAIVLRNEFNEGKGASLIKGFNYALAKGYDAVITMDGDGQHLPEDLPYFIRLAGHSNSGILIGNRMSKTRGMPFLRFATNAFMSWLISKITKQNIPDTQCGLRLIKREVLEKIKLKTLKYEIESEIIIRASRLGFKIESVPIKTVYRGEKSQINPFRDTFRFTKFIIYELWNKEN
jgi:glycosyltransferase involved in cell wall biosynthesis